MNSVKSPMCRDTATSCSGAKRAGSSHAASVSSSMSTTVSSRGRLTARGKRFSVRAKRVSMSARYGEAGSLPSVRSWKLARIARSKNSRSSTRRMIANSKFARIRARGRPTGVETPLAPRRREHAAGGAHPLPAVRRPPPGQATRREGVGMRSLKVELAAASTTEEVVARVAALAADPTVHGILVQHPVPRHVDERRVFETVPSAKDVDGLTLTSFGGVSFGLPGVGYGSCTPEGIVRLLDAYQVELSGRRAVVIGRSPILGKPMAMMLLARDATVTICHSRTRDLGAIVAEADVVVAAVGKARFVQGAWIKPGAVVAAGG